MQISLGRGNSVSHCINSCIRKFVLSRYLLVMEIVYVDCFVYRIMGTEV